MTANHIARWNGTAWSALGVGLDGPVQAIAIHGSDVYVGGAFQHAGGLTANGIARWDADTGAWSSLAGGFFNGDVSAIAVDSSGVVYAGGSFTSVYGTGATVRNIARWDGSAWSALGSGAAVGVDGRVTALAVAGADLYAGGAFTTAGAAAAAHVARSECLRLVGAGHGHGRDGAQPRGCRRLAGCRRRLHNSGRRGRQPGRAVDPGHRMAGPRERRRRRRSQQHRQLHWPPITRSCTWAADSPRPAANPGTSTTWCGPDLAGSQWFPMGTTPAGGLNGPVLALARDPNSTDGVYAGGTFTRAGSASANRVAALERMGWLDLTGRGG